MMDDRMYLVSTMDDLEFVSMFLVNTMDDQEILYQSKHQVDNDTSLGLATDSLKLKLV